MDRYDIDSSFRVFFRRFSRVFPGQMHPWGVKKREKYNKFYILQYFENNGKHIFFAASPFWRGIP
jgi:hypothetical protein